MSNTVHTARWLAQLSGEGHELHLFAVGQGVPHPELSGVTLHSLLWQTSTKQPELKRLGVPWPFKRGISAAFNSLEAHVPGLAPAQRLARTIRHLKPDLVHVLHMQHAGYLTSAALELLEPHQVPRVAYSSWGSDMYYYGKMPDHAPRIRALLARADYYIADCRRDVALAVEFGFRGQTLGVFPVGGGYDLPAVRAHLSADAPAKRRAIALKGYHQSNWAGRALVGLHAIQLCADVLGDYEVVVFSATPNTHHAAEFLARTTGLRVTLMPTASHDEMFSLLGRCRVSIGLSITDGTPNAMLEAMILGALPLQSDTVSTAEWIDDGKNGLLVPPEDAAAVATALRRAVTDDALVDQAARLNWTLADERLSREPMRQAVLAAYRQMAQR